MAYKHRFDHKKFRVDEDEKPKLSKLSTSAGKELNGKGQGMKALEDDLEILRAAQDRLFAEGQRSLLIILQGMDAGGKDGTIRHVMSGINPQGCRVHGFRAPNTEELQHHFLWRPMKFLPEKGMIAIFNRSYYEEVLVVRVHPEFLAPQKLPPIKKLSQFWEQRFEEIRQFEKVITNQGTTVLKFFLNVSADEQKTRLLERIHSPEKRWKFNEHDLEERQLWREYQKAIEEMLPATSTKESPWYVIPADDKWYARAAVADIISSNLTAMDLRYPVIDKEKEVRFNELAQQLEKE